MRDVLIAGAGPAGSIAAIVLARAGARVLLVDRETFPRGKLCGDTLNPGALALLDELGLSREWPAGTPTLGGMLVTGPGARVIARYPPPLRGLALTREIFDAWLLDCAVDAGAEFEPGLTVTRARAARKNGVTLVEGVEARGRDGRAVQIPARMTIAAEGRRSPTALSVGLIAHPARPRRWAFGTYVEGVAGLSDQGEMHVRPGHYVGIAPMGAGLANVCVVTSSPRLTGSPLEFIRRAIAADPDLRERCAAARFEAPVRVLGPLAVDARDAGVPGLLLAGDAAGFIDPMTGDGLHLAMRGAVLAADAALAALASGDAAAAVRHLVERRRAVLGRKLRFNRALRGLVESPMGVRMAGYSAVLAPQILRRIITAAGDAA